MNMWFAGLLLTAIGAALAAVGYFYFNFSLWLMIAGGLLVLVGSSLISGANDALIWSRHRSDSAETNRKR